MYRKILFVVLLLCAVCLQVPAVQAHRLSSSTIHAGAHSQTPFDDVLGDPSINDNPDSMVVIPSGDTNPPSPPANLRIEDITDNSVSLAWDPSSDDTGVAGYLIYRTNGALLEIDAGDVTTFVDFGLTSGETYSYVVKAYDSSGNLSNPSNVVQGTALSGDTVPPMPVELHLAALTDNSVLLNWTESFDDTGVAGYMIIRADIPSPGTFELYDVVDSMTLSNIDSNVISGEIYEYLVKALDTSGHISEPSNIVQVNIPSGYVNPPTNLHIMGVTESSVTLGWDPSPDPNLAGYVIYRTNGATVDVDVGNVTSFIDPAVVSGDIYEYWVKAYVMSGNLSDPSNRVVITVPGGPTAVTMSLARVSNGQPTWWPAAGFVMLGLGTAVTIWHLRRRKDDRLID